MAQLAIKGHPTRGKEVIQLLETLGGSNKYHFRGDEDEWFILNGNIQRSDLLFDEKGFTLEEFEEKFPYKVGDKVLYKPDNKKYFIIKMFWSYDRILYALSDEVCLEGCSMPDALISDVDVLKLQPYKEQETIDKTKFPYEIGTRVLVKGTYFDKLATIVGLSYNSCASMQYEIQFDGEDVVVHYPTNLMTPIITEQSMEEKDEKSANHIFDTEIISFDIAQRDKYELDLQGKFKVVLREGKYYVERIKPTYPKTYEECCKVLGYSGNYNMILTTDIDCKLFNALYRIKVCRDAYWKIAGKQMGLGKPWEPDWGDDEWSDMYYISFDGKHIDKEKGYPCCNMILIFPTAEMRDAFFENFKDLIEQCKELL